MLGHCRGPRVSREDVQAGLVRTQRRDLRLGGLSIQSHPPLLGARLGAVGHDLGHGVIVAEQGLQ